MNHQSSRTEKAIVDAIFLLLEKHNFEEITVNDICVAADVGRTTFYEHFEDKYALLVCAIQALISEAFSVELDDADALKSIFRNLLDALEKRRVAIRRLVRHDINNELHRKLNDSYAGYFFNIYSDMRPNMDANRMRLLAEYNSAGVAGLIEWWLKQEKPPEKAIVVELLTEKSGDLT